MSSAGFYFILAWVILLTSEIQNAVYGIMKYVTFIQYLSFSECKLYNTEDHVYSRNISLIYEMIKRMKN